MEVVGAVASVAGVLQLAGNALQAINVLATFVRNVKQAPEEFSAVRREITELSGVLQNILVLGPALADALDLDRNPEAKAPILTLHRAVWNCHHEMSGWSKKVQKDTAEGKARFTSFMRKLKFATLGKDDIVKLRRSIDSEKQSLTLVLAMLTSFLGQYGSKAIERMEKEMTTEVSGLTQSNLALSSTIIQVSEQAAAQGDELWNLAAEGFTAIEASISRSVDTQEKSMSVRHKETQSNISSVGESIATLATSVSKLAEKVARMESHCSSPGFPHAPLRRSRSNASVPDMRRGDQPGTPSRVISTSQLRRTKEESRLPSPATPASADNPRIQLAKVKPLFCCDALSGIDDAFREMPQTEAGRTVQCLYCEDVFEDTNPRALGRHLVDAHAFGKCNLDEAYTGWQRFANHLEHFHNTVLSSNELSRMKRRFIARHCNYQQASKKLTSSAKPTPTEKNTDHVLIELRLSMILAELRVYSPPTARPFKACDALNLAHGLRRLDGRAFTDSASQHALAARLCEAACLEEELIVACDRPLAYNWSMFNLYEHLASGTLDLGLVAHSQPRRQQACWWVCVEPRDYTGATLGTCKDCLRGTAYGSRDSAVRHLESYHPHAVKDGRTCWVNSFPRPLHYRDICYPTEQSWELLDSWMLGVFFESDYLRTLLRSGVIFETGGPSPGGFEGCRRLQFDIPLRARDNTSWALDIGERFHAGPHVVAPRDRSHSNHSKRAVDGKEELETEIDSSIEVEHHEFLTRPLAVW